MSDSAVGATYEDWVGREEEHSGNLHESVIQAMAATIDMEPVPAAGDPLPPGWHWLFFNPTVRRGELGPDGHPARGGFLPPVELPRRMWAGSRIQYLAELPVGAEATRTSKILKVANKTGKRGALCFVTVQHTTSCCGVDCIVEEQDIVYKEATPPGTPAPKPQPHEAESTWSELVEPDTTLLFRFSALTFNGHRIHYDQEYARNEEGYPDLVVHGPLTAVLLQQFAQQHGGGRRLRSFDFRGVNPLFVDRAFRLQGHAEEDGTLAVWAVGPDGELAMSATASFE